MAGCGRAASAAWRLRHSGQAWARLRPLLPRPLLVATLPPLLPLLRLLRPRLQQVSRLPRQRQRSPPLLLGLLQPALVSLVPGAQLQVAALPLLLLLLLLLLSARQRSLQRARLPLPLLLLLLPQVGCWLPVRCLLLSLLGR